MCLNQWSLNPQIGRFMNFDISYNLPNIISSLSSGVFKFFVDITKTLKTFVVQFIFSGLEITEPVLKRLDLVKQMNYINNSRNKQFFYLRNVLFSSEIDLYAFISDKLKVIHTETKGETCLELSLIFRSMKLGQCILPLSIIKII